MRKTWEKTKLKKKKEIEGQNQRKDIKGILPTPISIELLIKNLKNNKDRSYNMKKYGKD